MHPQLEIDLGWEGLDQAFAELERECTDIVRGITVMVWDSILVKTPQYAGGMAASWSYSIGAPQFYDRSYLLLDSQLGPGTNANGHFSVLSPRKRGDPQAIEIANLDNVGSESMFKLGDTVYIANGVDHGEGPYSYDVESGAVRLRSVNLPGAPASRSIDQVGARFAENVTPRAAENLKRLRIGAHLADADS